MNFPITINFKHLDKILLRLEQSRKGTVFMPFFMSALCFLSDWFILRHYLVDSLFLSIFRLIYVLAGAICLTVWLTKLYNELCDIKDEKEREKQEAIEQILRTKDLVNLYSPILNNLCNDEKNVLKEISKSNNGVLVFKNKDIIKYSLIVQKINNDLFLINPQTQLIIRNGSNSSIVIVSSVFWEVLKEYFTGV